MNKRFLTLAGVAAVLSIGTFVVLNKVKPYKQEEPKVADVTSADQVFGGSLANPEAHAEGDAAPADAAPAPVTDTSVQPASSDNAAAADTAQAAAPAAGGDVAPLVPAGAEAAAPAAATDMAAAPAAEPAAAPAAEPAPVAEAPAVEAPAPAAVEKPKKKAKATSQTASKGSKSDSAKVWWPAEQADKLSIIYAGHASFKTAVVLMFNGAFFQADSVNANIKVTDKAGKAVAGAWELGENNRRMLVFPVAGPGTYKVSVAAGLTDSKGRKLGKKLSGPVVISK